MDSWKGAALRLSQSLLQIYLAVCRSMPIFRISPVHVGEMTSIAIRWYACGHLSQGPQNGGNYLLSSEPQIHEPPNHYIPSSSLCVLYLLFPRGWKSDGIRYQHISGFRGKRPYELLSYFCRSCPKSNSLHNTSSVVLPSSDLALI